MVGYHQTPNVLLDGLRWWHGTWIEDGIHVFRPLASYLLWNECWLGLRFGFEVVAWIGFALFFVLSLSCCALTWRLTRSLLAVLLCSTLCVTSHFHVFGGTMPDYWLAWFPVHHDLLFLLLLIGALFWLDVWLETQKKAHLLAMWACFGCGALVKEYLYIFPLLALLWVWARARDEVRRAAYRQVALLFGVVLALFVYRTLVLVHPYNPPHLKRVHFSRKPWMYWFPPFYRYIPTGLFWLPGLALLLYGLGVFWRRMWEKDAVRRALAWPGATPLALGATLGVLVTYWWLVVGAPFVAFWLLFDSRTMLLHLSDLFQMTFLIYVVGLVWKTRRERQGVLALGMLIFIYLPVFTYLGWHYTLAGWFVRASVWWPLVVRDLGLEQWWPRALAYLRSGQHQLPQSSVEAST